MVLAVEWEEVLLTIRNLHATVLFIIWISVQKIHSKQGNFSFVCLLRHNSSMTVLKSVTLPSISRYDSLSTTDQIMGTISTSYKHKIFSLILNLMCFFPLWNDKHCILKWISSSFYSLYFLFSMLANWRFQPYFKFESIANTFSSSVRNLQSSDSKCFKESCST
jgi:hypothetical protein